MARKVAVVIAVVLVGAVVAWRCWPQRGEQESTAARGASGSAGMHAHGRAAQATPASLSGRVTRASDKAGIDGAVVSITHADSISELSQESPTIVVVADATGAWSAPKIPPGAYVVAATAPGFVPAKLPKLWLGAGEQRTGIILALDAGGTLVRGTVTDIGGGPIRGARVIVHQSSTLDWQQADFAAITGADGSYQLTLRDGIYDAVAQHEDYTRVEHELEVAGKPVTLDFVLTPGAVIRGVVIAKDTNKPVPHALVTARGHARGGGNGLPDATAGDDGTFAVKGVRPGLIAITAIARGYASSAPTTVAIGIGEQVDNVRVVVDRAYSISGRVIKQGTKDGIAGIHVGAFSTAKGTQAIDPDPTDDDGKFEIFGVRPGKYMLFALGENTVPEIGKPVEIVDKDVTGIEIELSVGVTISGRVEPPQVATLSIELAGEVGLANLFDAVKTMAVHAESGADGQFKLQNVPSGALKIIARTTAGPRGSQPITVGNADQSNIVVRLEVRAAVSGRVIDTSNAPVAGARVRAEPLAEQKAQFFSGDRDNLTRTSADGSFKIVGLDPGTYKLIATHGDDEPFVTMNLGKDKKKPLEVELVAGVDKTGVTITIEARNGVIRGQVIGGDHKPTPDVWVTARSVGERPKDAPEEFDEWLPTSDPVLTDGDGKFTIGKLRQGTYTVIAEGPRGSSRAEKTGVKTGDSVTIELQPLGALSGHVMMRGAPVTAYSIDCHGPAGQVDRAIAAADGAYSLEHLAPGNYRCTAEADSGTAKGTVDVPSGGATLELVLVRWASITGVVVSMFTGAPVARISAVVEGGDGRDMLEVITGNAPKTDATGRFDIKSVGAGSGTVVILDGTSGFTPLATKPYTVAEGQRVDLGAIKIVPPRQGDAGTFGMSVNGGGPAVTVTYVKPGGPADQAGVKTDDKIASINGRAVGELGTTQAATFLSSGQIGVGETVQLALDRGGPPVAVSVTSVKW